MLSKTTERALEQITALADSIRELCQRRDARRMGCSYVTRAAMESGHVTLTNSKPWSKLPKSTRKCFENSLLRMRPKRKPLSADERKQLARLLGFSR